MATPNQATQRKPGPAEWHREGKSLCCQPSPGTHVTEVPTTLSSCYFSNQNNVYASPTRSDLPPAPGRPMQVPCTPRFKVSPGPLSPCTGSGGDGTAPRGSLCSYCLAARSPLASPDPVPLLHRKSYPQDNTMSAFHGIFGRPFTVTGACFVKTKHGIIFYYPWSSSPTL